MNHIDELISEIQRLIDITSRENETQKQRLNFLFRQLERAKNLANYQENPQLLNAFLLIQGFYPKQPEDSHFHKWGMNGQRNFLTNSVLK